MSKKITLIIGARPNFMKAFPVYEALKNDFELTLIHTGQHFDEKMSDVFFNQLKFPRPDIHLTLEKKTKSGHFDDKMYVNNGDYLKDNDTVIQELMTYDSDLGQLGEIRDKLKVEFEKCNPDLVVVFGDVTSTLSAGLAAKILNIDLAHVESGLRSGDMSMPEEVNRVLTDHITKYYFITEQSGVDNLKEIGVTENVYLVGNTMIDTQKKYLQQALDTKYSETLGVTSKGYILITLHRPSNVDDMDKLKEIFDDFEELSKTEKLVYPIHPRTKNNLKKLGYLKKVQDNPNIILDEPLGYLEFTCLMVNCKYLVTDSGGLQEEITALDIPCFTLRENTERPSTMIENNGTNRLINKISDIKLKECKSSMYLWDGKSSERIRDILKKKIYSLRIAVGYAYSGKNIGGVRRYIENIDNLSNHNISLYPNYENDSIFKNIYDIQEKNKYIRYNSNQIITKQQEIIDNHDVFHSNVDPTWIKLCEEAQRQGKLWIHTYHNIYMSEDEPDKKLKVWQEEINDVQFNIASKADYKLCVGEWLVDECKKRNINSEFIPNFIPIDKLSKIKKNNFKNKYYLNEFILFSGDASIRKNCVEFIKTAKHLPQYKFVLMGTGLTNEEIIKTHNIELTGNVIAMGPLSHEECLEAMNDCNILVMNSFTEGLPTVLIEAMYYEKPCIIPDGPDWAKYLLKDNNIGYKYPLGNVEMLSEKISEIMKDYKELPLAKKYVEDTFSSNVVIRKLDEMYLFNKKTKNMIIYDYYITSNVNIEEKIKFSNNLLNDIFKPELSIVNTIPYKNILMPNWSNFKDDTNLNINNYDMWDLYRHGLEWLINVLDVYIYTKDIKYYNFIIKNFIDWIYTIYDKNIINSKKIYDDHPMSMRIMSLINFHNFIYKNNFENNKLKNKLIEVINDTTLRLHNWLMIKKDKYLSNHILIACISLVYSIDYLNNYKQCLNKKILLIENIFDITKIIDNYIIKNFTEEGINIESSPGYQFHILVYLIRFIYTLCKINKQQYITPVMIKYISIAYPFLDIFLRNNYSLPIIGDTSLYLDIYKNKNEKYNNLDELFNFINNKLMLKYEKINKKYLFKIYKDSGYIFKYIDDLKIIIRTKPKYHTYHTHNDELSLNLYRKDIDWITDTGFYPDKLNEFRSRMMHNVIIRNMNNEKLINQQTKIYTKSENNISILFSNDKFDHTREFIFKNKKEIIIIDFIKNKDINEKSIFNLLYHINNTLQIENKNKNEFLLSDNKNNYLTIRQEEKCCDNNTCWICKNHNNIKTKIQESIILNGCKNPFIGWISYDPSKLLKTNTIIYNSKLSNKFVFKTYFKFH